MRSWMIGLILGVLPVLLLPALPGFWLPLLLLPVALALLRGAGPGHFCSGVVLGCALALANGQLFVNQRIAGHCESRPLLLTGEVAALPSHRLFADGTARQRFELDVRALEPAECRGPQRILLSYYGTAKMIPGDVWTFHVKLSRPWGQANPGVFNMQAWYAQAGIDAVGTVSGARGARQPGRPGLASLPDRTRQAISERIHALQVGSRVAAVLAAVTVADKSGIDAALWSLFQQFGINHLLVISGLHVSLVAGAAYLLGGFVQRLLLLTGVFAAWIPAVFALLCCAAYTALAGFSIATQRALCMLLCFILAALAGRHSSSANNLLLAAVVVLMLNPLAPLGSGFWLSFAAVAALLWLSRWQPGRPPWQRALWTHGFMSLVMMPLGAWWFGGSSVVAAAANLLMVPLTGLLVVPAALLAVVAGYLAPAVEMPLWRLAAWPLQQLLPAAQWLAGKGDGWLYQPLSADLPAVVLAGCGVTLLILPGSCYARALALAMALPLLLPPQFSGNYAGDVLPDAATTVTVLDVGQGTAVIIRAGDRTLVYDTGGGDPAGANMATNVVLPWLRQQGVTQLDVLVISHPDNDHSAGSGSLLSALPVGRVYYGGEVPGLDRGRSCIAGNAWRWPGGQDFQFLSPAGGAVGSSNDSSCVLQVETGSHKLLLLGDVESAQERELVRYWGPDLASDWLLVAHHGSRTSSTHALLKTVQPAIAVISSGYANRFGHPHADVVGRLKGVGAEVYGTARGGALVFEFTAGHAVRTSSYRRQKRRFWM